MSSIWGAIEGQLVRLMPSNSLTRIRPPTPSTVNGTLPWRAQAAVVPVDQEGLVALEGEVRGEVDGGAGLPDAALAGHDRNTGSHQGQHTDLQVLLPVLLQCYINTNRH